MALKLVTAPSDVVSLEEAKRHLAVLHSDDDDYIRSLVASATAWLDGADGYLGRAIGLQTWDLVLDDFPVADIDVPLSPLVSVTSVTYAAPETGADTVLVEGTDYAVDTYNDPGRITLVRDCWPETKSIANALKIRFVAGYLTAPTPLKSAVLLMVHDWYKSRSSAHEDASRDVPQIVYQLTAPYHNWLYL